MKHEKNKNFQLAWDLVNLNATLVNFTIETQLLKGKIYELSCNSDAIKALCHIWEATECEKELQLPNIQEFHNNINQFNEESILIEKICKIIMEEN